MGIDIRFPLGLMFAILGFLLWAYGLLGNKAIYIRSLGININLMWGVVLFFFGVAMLLLALRARGKARPVDAPDSQRGAGH